MKFLLKSLSVIQIASGSSKLRAILGDNLGNFIPDNSEQVGLDFLIKEHSVHSNFLSMAEVS
jgi:hypothetical protein